MEYMHCGMAVRLVLVLVTAGAACAVGGIDDPLVAGGPTTGDDGDNGDDGSVSADAAVVSVVDAAIVIGAADAALADEPPATFEVGELSRDAVLSIAKASVGYTYWWGHGSLGGTLAGTCTGSCPSCTHTGAHGADCSGFVGKAWMLPEALPIVGDDSHPYSTYNFSHQSTHWSSIARGDVVRGDAMVYNVNGSGHIFLYEKDDPWGSMWTYEARGCAYGIVHNIRTAPSLFSAIRRDGL
jgi:hypothetical protein